MMSKMMVQMPRSNHTRGSISGRGSSAGRGSAARQLFGDQTDERVTDLGDQTQSPIHSGDDDDDDIPEIPVPARNARKWCYISGDRLVCDEDIVDSKVSACMTQIFKKSILPNGYKWKHVRQNKEHMDMYFNEFKEEIKAREIAFQERGGEVDPNEIFMEVVPVKKQRLFGTGSVGSSRVSKNVVSSSSSQSQGESESLRHQLDSLSAQLEEERVLRTQRELEIQEQLANSKREMEESRAALEASLEERVAEATAAMMRQFEERFGRQPPPS
ncbi:hypothetical protein OROHE_026599 [Orobanche hederae]